MSSKEAITRLHVAIRGRDYNEMMKEVNREKELFCTEIALVIIKEVANVINEYAETWQPLLCATLPCDIVANLDCYITEEDSLTVLTKTCLKSEEYSPDSKKIFNYLLESGVPPYASMSLNEGLMQSVTLGHQRSPREAVVTQMRSDIKHYLTKVDISAEQANKEAYIIKQRAELNEEQQDGLLAALEHFSWKLSHAQGWQKEVISHILVTELSSLSWQKIKDNQANCNPISVRRRMGNKKTPKAILLSIARYLSPSADPGVQHAKAHIQSLLQNA